MKMHHPVEAPVDGTVASIEVVVGDTVATNSIVARVTAGAVVADAAPSDAAPPAAVGVRSDLAARLVAIAGFGLTGQACTATSRVIVERSVAEAFTAKLIEKAKAIVVGNGLKPGVTMGPAVSRAQPENAPGLRSLTLAGMT